MLKQKQFGFSLIELIAVIVLLGSLSVAALPRYLDLSSDAHISVLKQLSAAAKTENKLIQLKAQLPSYAVQTVAGRSDLKDIDLDGNGSFDIRLKCDYLDNTDIEKRVFYPDSHVISYQGIAITYMGYDFDGNNSPVDDNCYFKYTQAQAPGNVCNNVPPDYEIVSSGC